MVFLVTPSDFAAMDKLPNALIMASSMIFLSGFFISV
jgi:hypothetical protein